MEEEDQWEALKQAKRDNEAATRKEIVYRDVLKYYSVKQSYRRRSRIRAEAFVDRIWETPPMDPNQEVSNRRWRGKR